MATGEAHLTGDTTKATKAEGPEARLEQLEADLEAKDDETSAAL